MNDVTFAKTLASVMLDNKYDRFVKNRKTGKLDTRSLYKIDTSSRLFKRREARKNKNYAVSLVVDCSGSMSGDKAAMAALAAAKMSKHLSGMDIPHNIVIFNIFVDEIKPFNPKYDPEIEEKILGNVGNGPMYRLLKYAVHDKDEFVSNPRTGRNMRKFIGMFDSKGIKPYKSTGKHIVSEATGMNSDAEALRFAKDRILEEKGKRILIYFSDGSPAFMADNMESPINKGYSQNEFDLKKEVEKTIKSGVELYSIGIQNDSVNHYYPPKRTCVINNLDQLYPHVIKLIRINLKRG